MSRDMDAPPIDIQGTPSNDAASSMGGENFNAVGRLLNIQRRIPPFISAVAKV